MRTFFKRNRIIKLFTIGWIFSMTVISALLLLRTPSSDEDGAAMGLLSGAYNFNKSECTYCMIQDSNNSWHVIAVIPVNDTVLYVNLTQCAAMQEVIESRNEWKYDL